MTVTVIIINAIILPLHVLEEWVVPGGFHYAYNLRKKSPPELLHRYPMSRMTDMWTNLLGEIFFLALIACNAGKALAFSVMMFDYMEAVMHTLIGVQMYGRFKSKGKKAIYGPGSVTANFGHLVVAVIMTVWFFQKGLTWTQAGIGILAMLAGSTIMVNLPEKILAKKDNPYSFSDAGYFEKFLG